MGKVVTLWICLVIVSVTITIGSSQSGGKRCYRTNQDIVFLVDRSGSITDPNQTNMKNWVLLRNFIIALIDKLDVGESGTHVGLVTFGNIGENIFFLNNYTTKAEIKAAIDRLPHPNGNTNTQAGLFRVRTEQFTPEHGDRRDAPNACVVITDGQSTINITNTIPEAQKMYDAGISMWAVGITREINEAELAAIGINKYWLSLDFTELDDLLTKLTTIQCVGEIDYDVCDSIYSCDNRDPCYFNKDNIQICPCSFNWVSKFCSQQRPDTKSSKLNGDCIEFSHAVESVGPQMELMCPTKGPASGGTNVAIWGKRLDGIVRGRRGRRQLDVAAVVNFGGNACKVLSSNSTYINCRTSPCWMANTTDFPDGLLNLTLEAGEHVVMESDVFDCLADPIIFDINPLESFIEGGVHLTVVGKYLDSVSTAILEITMTYIASTGPINTKFAKDCIPSSGDQIFCPTPPIVLPASFRAKRSLPDDDPESNHGSMDTDMEMRGQDAARSRRKRQTMVGDSTVAYQQKEKLNTKDVLQFYIGMKLDGVSTYRNMSLVKEPLGILTVYRNPEVDDFEETERIRKFNPGFPDKHDYLDIKGDRLDLGSLEESWTVMIGRGRCEVTILSRGILTCTPPLQRPEETPGLTRDGALLVEVRVGNLYFTPGYLKYTSGIEVDVIKSIAIGVPVGLLLLLLLLLLVALCIVKQRKWLEKLHLQRIADIERAVRGNLTAQTDLMAELSPGVQQKVESSLVDPSRVEIEREVGSGFFGVVYCGWLQTDTGNKLQVAIKTMKVRHPSLADTVSFMDEATILQQFNHPNVLSLVGIAIQDNVPRIMTPYMANGDLKAYLKLSSKSLSCAYLVQACSDVADGMAHLTDKRFVHRDLAARNVMVDADQNVKIADFGLSRDVHSSDYYKAGANSKPMPVKWMALESLEGGIYNANTDVWSFGVLMWEALTFGKQPYADVSNLGMRSYLSNNHRLGRPTGCPEEIYTIMRSCWNPQPEKRLRFAVLKTRLSKLVNRSELRYSRIPQSTKEHGQQSRSSLSRDEDARYLNDPTEVSDRLATGQYLTPIADKDAKGQGSVNAAYNNEHMDVANEHMMSCGDYLKTGTGAEDGSREEGV